MTAVEIKTDLHSLIDKIEDVNVLEACKILLIKHAPSSKTNDENESWDELPEKVKTDINEALLESERGEGIPHEEVISHVKENLPEYENNLASEGIKKLFSSL